MDDRHPKRRKDKYNPYTLSLVDGKCYLSFKDGQGFPHKLELDVKLYALFDRFELDDIYYADLTPVVGCEQGGRRPVLVIQNDVGNHHGKKKTEAAHPYRAAQAAHRAEDCVLCYAGTGADH